MNTLLIATHNQAKLTELKISLNKYSKNKIRFLSLNDLKISEEPEETGETFEANAKIKAEFYANLTNLPTIADDGGLIVPVLNNEPGVKSRRWLGRESTDDELINFTLSNLRSFNKNNRTAFLEVCLCYFNPKTKKLVFIQEKIIGHIALKPTNKRINGYPFRALFIVDQFNKYYDELTEKEHEKVNHRLKAVRKLMKKIESLI